MKKKKLSEQEIDEIIIQESDDLTKWEEPVLVKTSCAISILLSQNTIEKVKYFAKLHKYQGFQTWLKKIIEERVKIEEEILNRRGDTCRVGRGFKENNNPIKS